MDHFNTFLNSSTIHGIHFIPKTKKFGKLFWILVVISSFTAASLLIYESFHNWDLSPVSTTVETVAISKLPFPNVTVCPPKKAGLGLNFDIVQAEKLKLKNETRNELFKIAIQVILDDENIEIMFNLSKIYEQNRYYNWYHGYTKLQYPTYYQYSNPKVTYYVETCSIAGNITTREFGAKFDSDKIESYKVEVKIHVPERIKGNENVSISFDLERNKMKNLIDKNDEDSVQSNIGEIQEHDRYSRIINGPNPSGGYFNLKNTRKVSVETVRNSDQDLMPGFTLIWKYDSEEIIEEDSKFALTVPNREFFR